MIASVSIYHWYLPLLCGDGHSTCSDRASGDPPPVPCTTRPQNKNTACNSLCVRITKYILPERCICLACYSRYVLLLINFSDNCCCATAVQGQYLFARVYILGVLASTSD